MRSSGWASSLAPGERDRGAASVLVVGVIAVLLLLTAGALTVVRAVAAGHRAGLAADLAAIAAAMELQGTNELGSACGRGAVVARENRARMTDCAVDGQDVTITVEVEVARWPAPAVARARAGPDRSAEAVPRGERGALSRRSKAGEPVPGALHFGGSPHGMRSLSSRPSSPSRRDTGEPYRRGMRDAGPDLEQLRLLVAIADHAGLGAASRSLGIAQPNASRSLRRLERDLGLGLVVRSPAGSRLTPQGAVVVHWAREVLEASDRLLAGAKTLAAENSANLAIAASLTIAEYLVPRWLSAFRAVDSQVRVNLAVCNSRDVFARIDSDDCDLGFIESPSMPRGLRWTVVGQDELLVVVAPTHPWVRRRRPVTADELAATALVVRESGSGTRVSLEHHLAGRVMADPAVELGSNAAVRIMAASGSAPAVLSRLAVAQALEAGELVAVPVEGLRLTRRLRAVWRGHLSPSAAGLLTVIRPAAPPRRAGAPRTRETS